MSTGQLADAGRGDAVVIAGLPARDDPADLPGYEPDAVVLTAEERRRGRRRVVTRAGRVFTLMLPPGEVLAPGRLLYVGPGASTSPGGSISVNTRPARVTTRRRPRRRSSAVSTTASGS